MGNTLIYTVKEVADILHTNKNYVYELIKHGLLPALKLGSLKIRREALIKFLDDNEGKNLTDPSNVILLNNL